MPYTKVFQAFWLVKTNGFMSLLALKMRTVRKFLKTNLVIQMEIPTFALWRKK